MQYRIVINLAVCAFSCFVANDLATDIYGERCKRVLLNILTNAVYVFLLMDMMLFPYAMILFPVIVFLGFMALSVNYNVDKKKNETYRKQSAENSRQDFCKFITIHCHQALCQQ